MGVEDLKHIPFLGDRMEWAAAFPDQFFDLILDDFPYGIGAGKMGFTREGGRYAKQKSGKKLYIPKEAYEQMDWDSETPPQEYFDEMRRISKNQVMFGIEYVDWLNVSSGRLKWDKMVPEGLSFKGYELAFQSFTDQVEDLKCLWSGFNQARSINNPTAQQGNKKRNDPRIHPTQKPIILWRLILRKYGVPPGSVIGCPHFGSGSNRIACYEEKMHWYGCEREPEYFNKSEAWFQQHLNRYPLFKL